MYIVAILLILQAFVFYAILIGDMLTYGIDAFASPTLYYLVSFVIAVAGVLLFSRLRRKIRVDRMTRIILIFPLVYSMFSMIIFPVSRLLPQSIDVDYLTNFGYAFLLVTPLAAITSIIYIMIALRTLYPDNK